MSFKEFDKIPRLHRQAVITEKIDGTNASIEILSAQDVALQFADGNDIVDPSYYIAKHEDGSVMFAGSRTRYVVPAADNYGFAAWVKANAGALWGLGPGQHFGEWWGGGVQRGYGLGKEKRFSLFNVGRWFDVHGTNPARGEKQSCLPECCWTVPILAEGVFSSSLVDSALATLKETGSKAALGFMNPEGIVVWHEAAKQLFKVTLEKDAEHKGQQG